MKTEFSTIIKKRTLGLTFVFGMASLSFAQDKENISGKISDTQNNPIPYASITFENIDNKAISNATLSDENGNYQLDLISGKYIVKIEAIDFDDFQQETTISNKNKHKNFVIVANSTQKTTNIQAVTISTTAKKPYKVELDKKTYDVSSDLLSKGGSLHDVLQNVPSVEIDTDGSVSMRGSSNVKFLINGKPSAMFGIDDSTTALQSIPSDQIDRIEVITNPSSKFEASGTAGILNIILKKNKTAGLSGNVVGMVGYLPTTNINANINWKKGDFSWFINGGGSYKKSQAISRNNNFYTDKNTPNQLLKALQNGQDTDKISTFNASTGFVYDISNKTSINASTTLRIFNVNGEGTNDYQYTYNNTTLAKPYSLRNSTENQGHISWQGDLGLDHKFNDNGHKISFSASYQQNDRTNTTNINQESNNSFDRNFVANPLSPTLSELRTYTDQTNKNKKIFAGIDYELPIGDISKLEAGYRCDRDNNHWINLAQEKIGSETFNNIPEYTNNTIYKEMFNAIYVQFKSKIGNFGYQLGLRNEHSHININYENQRDGNVLDKIKNYNNLFPSVYLSYDLGKNNQILVNYSRRIDRPKGLYFIPYHSIADNQNIMLGNQNLDPSYVHSYEVGYAIQQKRLTINPTLYYRYKTDDVKKLTYQEDESTNVFYTTSINLGTRKDYGLDLNFSADLLPWWRLMGNISVSYYNIDGDTTYRTRDSSGNYVNRLASFKGEGMTSRGRLSTTFKVDKTLSLQLQGMYKGGIKTEYQHRLTTYTIDFALTKTILKGNATISFNIKDIFNTNAREVYTYSANAYRESYMRREPRQIQLSLTYNFKKGDKIENNKKKREVFQVEQED